MPRPRWLAHPELVDDELVAGTVLDRVTVFLGREVGDRILEPVSSCVNRAFSAGGKNFVFLGEKDDLCTLRLKRAGGWEKIEFDPSSPPPASDLEAWVDESFTLLAPKRVQKLRTD